MARHDRWRCGGVAAALLLLVAACGKAGPDDGGRPLETGTISEPLEQAIAHDPCFRMEHGHWHQSVGHCRPMMPAERLRGVWLTGFELSEFVPNAARFAEAAAREGGAHEIEIDEEQVQRVAGVKHAGPGAGGYEIAFIGRRTRDPVDVDCQGRARFTIVVDRLLTARDAGTEPPPMRGITHAEMEDQLARLKALPTTVAVRHGGEWGKREAGAVERCRRHGN